MNNLCIFEDDSDPATTAMWIGLTTEVQTDSIGATGIRTRWIDGMYDAYTHFQYGTKLAENQCFKIVSNEQKGEWVATSNCDEPLPYVCKMELKAKMKTLNVCPEIFINRNPTVASVPRRANLASIFLQ